MKTRRLLGPIIGLTVLVTYLPAAATTTIDLKGPIGFLSIQTTGLSGTVNISQQYTDVLVAPGIFPLSALLHPYDFSAVDSNNAVTDFKLNQGLGAVFPAFDPNNPLKTYSAGPSPIVSINITPADVALQISASAFNEIINISSFKEDLFLQYDDGLLVAPPGTIVTPLPPALPLLASALGLAGLFGLRRQRK